MSDLSTVPKHLVLRITRGLHYHIRTSATLSGHDFNIMSDVMYPVSLLVSRRYFSITLGPWYDTSHCVRLKVPRQVLSTTLQFQHQIPPQHHFSSCRELTRLSGPQCNIRLPVSYKDLSTVLDPSITSGTEHNTKTSASCQELNISTV